MGLNKIFQDLYWHSKNNFRIPRASAPQNNTRKGASVSSSMLVSETFSFTRFVL